MALGFVRCGSSLRAIDGSVSARVVWRAVVRPPVLLSPGSEQVIARESIGGSAVTGDSEPGTCNALGPGQICELRPKAWDM